MNLLVLLSMFFALQGGNKKDYISIEYAGNADKPVDVIYMSKDSIPHLERAIYFEYSGPVFDYIVSDQDLLFVKREILSSIKKPFEDNDYRGFKMTIRENDSTISYFIFDKNAIHFFDDLIDHFKVNKKYNDMISLLSVHKKHIGY